MGSYVIQKFCVPFCSQQNSQTGPRSHNFSRLYNLKRLKDGAISDVTKTQLMHNKEHKRKEENYTIMESNTLTQCNQTANGLSNCWRHYSCPIEVLDHHQVGMLRMKHFLPGVRILWIRTSNGSWSRRGFWWSMYLISIPAAAAAAISFGPKCFFAYMKRTAHPQDLQVNIVQKPINH